MEIYTIERPLPQTAAVCATLPVLLPSVHESVVIPAAAERALLPMAYQAQAQSELAMDLLPTTGSNGTFGFRGGLGWTTKKRSTIVARGVPPRGRPV